MLEEIPACIYKHSLQVFHSTSLGWLFGLHNDILISIFEQLLQEIVANLAPQQQPVVKYSLLYKPIWDGTLCKEWEMAQSFSKYAIHVEAIAEIALTYNLSPSCP